MYRWVDHTAELELEIDAASEEAVLAEALTALSELVGERSGPPIAGRITRQVVARAGDRAALLAELLSEVVYLVESEGFVPERVERIELDDGAVEATLTGRHASPSHLVKAVTYHRLDMWEEDEAWRARVILDV